MIICKSCSTQNPEDSEFCSGCGAMLAKNNCPKCTAPIIEGAKFCNKCGCKLTKDNKCVACGKELNPIDEFCPDCGTSVNAMASDSSRQSIGTYSAAVAQPKMDSAKKSWLRHMIIAWVFAALMLTTLLLGLAPITTVKVDIGDMKYDIGVTGVDIIAAPFRLIKPKEGDEILKELDKYSNKHINIGANASPREIIDETERILTNFGFFKLAINADSVEASSFLLNLWLVISFYYLFMIAMLFFFIVLLIKALNLTIKKDTKPFKFTQLFAAVGMGMLSLICVLINGLPAVATILVMVFSILAIYACSVVSMVLKEETISVKRIISKNVSLFVSIMLLCFTVFASTQITYTNAKGNETHFNSMFSDAMAGFDYDSEMFSETQKQSLVDFMEQLKSQENIENIQGMDTVLNPITLLTFEENLSFKPLAILAALFTWLSMLSLAIGLGGTIAASAIGLGNDKLKKVSLGFMIATILGFVFMLVTSITLTAACNSMFAQLKLTTMLDAKIGLLSILGLVFSTGILVQHCIVAALSKDKVKPKALI